MAWNSDILVMVRGIISDVDIPYTYSDAKLINLIVIAGSLLSKSLTFLNTYTIDFGSQSISPDPSGPPQDYAFYNLVALKVAELLAYGELKITAGSVVDWKNGPASLSNAGTYTAQKALYEIAKDNFEQAMLQHACGNTAPGKSILGPFSSDNLYGYYR